jgi:hypothetical protein
MMDFSMMTLADWQSLVTAQCDVADDLESGLMARNIISQVRAQAMTPDTINLVRAKLIPAPLPPLQGGS